MLSATASRSTDYFPAWDDKPSSLSTLIAPVGVASVVICMWCFTATVSSLACYYAGRWIDHEVSGADQFMSTALDIGWGHRIGGFGLSVCAVLFVPIAFFRYCTILESIDEIPSGMRNQLMQRSQRSLLIASLVVCGDIGVGYFNVSFLASMHFGFAFLAFGALAVYQFEQWAMDDVFVGSLPMSSTKAFWHNFRLNLLIIISVTTVAWPVFLLLDLHLLASAFEWTCFFCQVGYVYTWAFRPSIACESRLTVTPHGSEERIEGFFLA